MKRTILIFCMFLLALPLVSAVITAPYELYNDTACYYDNFSSGGNWETSGNCAVSGGKLVCTSSLTGNNWAHNVHEHISADKNSINYSVEFTITGLDCADGTYSKILQLWNKNTTDYATDVNYLQGALAQYGGDNTKRLEDTQGGTRSTALGIAEGPTFYHIQVVIKTDGSGYVYVNGTLAGSEPLDAGAPNYNNQAFWNFGHIETNGDICGFVVDDWFSYNGSIKPDNCEGAPPPPPIPPAPSPTYNFTVYSKDYYDLSVLSNFQLYVENASNSYWFTTTNGVIYVTNLTIHSTDTLYDFRFVVSDYFTITYPNINFTKNGSLIGYPYQAIAYFNSSEIITDKRINNFWVNDSVNYNVSTAGGLATLYLKAGTYDITAGSTGYFNTKAHITIAAGELKNTTFYYGNTNLTILPYKVDGLTAIENFTVNISSFNYDYAIGTNLSKYNASFLLINGTYNISVRPKGFAFANLTYKINYGNFYPNLTFSLYTQNSFNFTILDEIIGRTTNIFNGKQVIIEMVGNLFSYNFSTTTGKLFVDLLTPQEYRIHYYSYDYPPRDFYFTLINDTHNTLELYLLSSGNSTDVTFSAVDESGIELENAYIYAKRYYVDSNSYRTVAMTKTNAEGESIINIDFNDAYYQILATYGNYQTQTTGAKIFSLTPTIKIQTTDNIFTDIDRVNNVITNLDFNNATKTFTYTFLSSSPVTGLLQVERVTPSSKTTVCTNLDTTISGTVLCTITPTGDNREQFNAYGYIDSGGYQLTNLKIYSQWTDMVREKLQTTGVFMSMLMAGTFAGLGAFSPVLSVIMFLIGMMGVAFFGFSSISWAVYFSIFILGGILIYKLKN